jgi:hypothetical protein
VERFEAAHIANHGQPSKAAEYELLFRPIAFVSGVRHIYKRVRKLIGNPSMVGFAEPSDCDAATPASLNQGRIRRVGPFQVCWNVKPVGFDATPVLTQLAESEGVA